MTFFTKRQLGLVPKSSTSDALITALHDLYGTIYDRKSIVMALFYPRPLIVSPATLFFRKFGAVGLTGHILSWLKSYLSDRSLLVYVHDGDSDPIPVIPSVPQVFVLVVIIY